MDLFILTGVGAGYHTSSDVLLPKLVAAGAVEGRLTRPVAVDTGAHGGGDFLLKDVTHRDRTMARLAVEAGFAVGGVTEEDEVGEFVNPDPADGAGLLLHGGMAKEAAVQVGDGGALGGQGFGMAISTLDTNSGVHLVAEGKRLRSHRERELLLDTLVGGLK
jgi:hypothetical protein